MPPQTMSIKNVINLADEAALGIRLVWRLSSFLKNPFSPDQAKKLIRDRLENRENDFLSLAKKNIYERPDSPYLVLLENAGCEWGDLQKLVHSNGLESCLQELYRSGVYLTSEEFRGQREMRRGSISFQVHPNQLRNPFARRDIPTRSSGSRSHGTQVIRDLAFVRDNTACLVAFLDARRSFSSEMASWSVPGGVTLSTLVKFYCAGIPPSRWFSQIDTSARELSARYRLSHHVVRLSGVLAGVRIPPSRYVSLEEPLPILHWMRDCLRNGKMPHLFTFSSSAVRLAQYAVEAGFDLEGAQLTVSGEPVTQARMDTIRNSGADVLPAMGCVELGHVADGCLKPEAPDDMHIIKDLLAVIQPGGSDAAQDLPPQALLFTSLRPTTPLIILNVSMGDHAVITRRSCGCPLDTLGYDTHIQYVRSFEKLTSGGMAFLDTEIIRILDVDLPGMFGGGPTDYQLLEEESGDGTPRLRLVVHPRVGPLDDEDVKKAFLKLIGSGPGAEKLTSLLWKASSMVSVDRAVPQTTSTGKIHHMHVNHKKG